MSGPRPRALGFHTKTLTEGPATPGGEGSCSARDQPETQAVLSWKPFLLVELSLVGPARKHRNRALGTMGGQSEPPLTRPHRGGREERCLLQLGQQRLPGTHPRAAGVWLCVCECARVCAKGVQPSWHSARALGSLLPPRAVRAWAAPRCHFARRTDVQQPRGHPCSEFSRGSVRCCRRPRKNVSSLLK